MRSPACALAVPLVLLLALPLHAQQASGRPGATGDVHPDDHASHAANEVMLFVGDTRKGGSNAFTVGFDYLRSIGDHWGAGIFLDYARDEFEREYIAGAGLFVAPIPAVPNLHIFAGGGWERLDEDHLHGHSAGAAGDAAHGWTTEDLLIGRIGGSFVFHLGHDSAWVLAPQAFYDVVEGRGRDAVVFGLGLGYLF